MTFNHMKQAFCIIIIFFNFSSKAQTTIAFQGFEGTINDNWNYVSPTQAGGSQPVIVGAGNYGVGYAHTGDNSCRAGGGSTDCGTGSSNCLNNATSGGGCTNLANSTIITFNTLDISCFTNVQIELWHRSNSLCVGAGFDGSDNLKFEVSIDGGPWTQIGLLSSSNNYIWDYTNVIAGVSSTVANPFVFTVPIGALSIAFQTNATVNRTDEVYYIDDVKITGTPSSLPLPNVAVSQPICSSPNGSITILSPVISGFTFSIDSINFLNTSGVFIGLLPGNNYYVQVQSPSGCSSPVLVVEIDSVISSSVSASIIALSSTNICNGDSVVLESGSGYTSYQWLIDGVDILNANGATYTAFNQGNYQVVVIDSTGCTDTSAVLSINNVFANPPIITSNTGNFSLCNGSNLSLFVPDLYNSYEWILNGVVISNANDSIYTASIAGDYQLIVSNSSGCYDTSAIQTVSISSSNPPMISSSTGSFEICADQQLTLSVSPLNSTYQWYFNSNAIAGANTNSLPISDAGSYNVLVQSVAGCIDTSLIAVVIINPLPVPTISPNNSIICANQSINFQTESFITYQWNLNNVPITNANAINYTAVVAGNYTVTVEDLNGCSAVSAIATITLDTLNVVINAGALNYCFGDTAILQATGYNINSLLWSNNSIGNDIQITQSGNYSVTATSQQGCTATSFYNLNFTNSITVQAVATDSILTCNETIELNVTGADYYLWQPASGLNDPNISNPIISGLTDSILYIVTGSKGNCTASDSIKIFYQECSDIFIPNAFSPNNDGKNDVFRILGNNIFDFKLSVYNRWGELVFESNKIDEGWDGKYKGKDVSAGVYVWVLDAKDANGKVINYHNKFSGNLNLFR